MSAGGFTMRFVLAVVFSLLYVTVYSKPGTFEDTYGPMDGDEKNIQNDEFDIYDGDTGDDPEENVTTKIEVTPEFKTKAQLFVAQIGESVRLPCEITAASDTVLVWKKESELLYQDGIAMKDFPNIRGTNESLDITITSQDDYGLYVCQMMLFDTNNPSIIHAVMPSPSPVITSLRTLNNKTVFNVGETLDLTCLALGKPPPKVSWLKDSERIESLGENITIPNLKPHNAGHYRCFADNDIGSPAHKYIEISVEHKPIVTIDEYLVNSNKEHDTNLKCTVRAYPTANVSWHKNGRNIKTYNVKKHQSSEEYNLVLKNLTDADFGEYTCLAENVLGKTEKHVSLIKAPVVQEFITPKNTNKDVVLTWKVQSKLPLTEHQLQYRRKGEEGWNTAKPEISYNVENDVYTVKYTLKGLEPGSYQTRSRSQNTHGWSSYSDIMPFEGVLAKHKPHHKKPHKDRDLKEKQAAPTMQATPSPHQGNESLVGAVQTDGCATAISSIYLTSIALLTLWYRQ